MSATAAPPSATISAATAAAGPASAPVPSMAPPRSLTTTDGAARGEQLGVGAADAPPGAGDDGDPAVEAILARRVRSGGHRSLEPEQPTERAADHGVTLVGRDTPANCSAMSWRLPRNVPSACG